MTQIDIQALGEVSSPNVDAKVFGFRALIGSEYIQYFTAAVDGLRLALEVNHPDDQYWMAVCDLAADSIASAVGEGIRSGVLPRAEKDRTEAIRLHIDPGAAVELLGRGTDIKPLHLAGYSTTRQIS